MKPMVGSNKQISTASSARGAMSLLKPLFEGGEIESFLEPLNLNKFASSWSDAAEHDFVLPEDRFGYAAIADDMVQIGHGLHSAQYAGIDVSAIPVTCEHLLRFLTNLVARGEKSRGDHLQNVIQLVEEHLSGPDQISSLKEHAKSLWRLRKNYPDFFAAAVVGDLAAAFLIARSILDDQQQAAFRALARQAIIWGAFDVHRVAARCRASKTTLVPWFMRPAVATESANELWAINEKIGKTIERLHSENDRQRETRPDTPVTPRGKSGLVLDMLDAWDIKEMASGYSITIEELDRVKEKIREISAKQVAEYAKLRKVNSTQQFTPHQQKYCGLSEISALFVVSLNYAIAVEKISRFIWEPNLNFDIRAFVDQAIPAVLPAGAITRAQQVMAAYRPAVMDRVGDFPVRRNHDGLSFADADASNTKVAISAGKKFLSEMAINHNRSEYCWLVMSDLQLGHRVRSTTISNSSKAPYLTVRWWRVTGKIPLPSHTCTSAQCFVSLINENVSFRYSEAGNISVDS